MWFGSYLSGHSRHTHCTLTRSTRYEPLPVTSGVPQGSVLGPVLFTLYILGIRDIITSYGVDYVLYADDIQLFCSTSPALLHLAIQRMQECISSLHSWLTTRRLTLNATKTELIVLGNKSSLRTLPPISILVCGVPIKPSSQVRDLGFYLDQDLSMETHITRTRAVMLSRFRNISRVRRFLPTSHAAIVIKSLIFSHLFFCASLLVGIEAKQIQRLQSTVNAVIRLLHRLPRTSNVSAIAREHGLLPVREHLQLRLLLFLRSIMSSGQPTFLAALVQPYVPRRSLRSDSANLLVIPTTHRKNTDRAFSVAAPRLWNSLPSDIRHSLSSDLHDVLFNHFAQ